MPEQLFKSGKMLNFIKAPSVIYIFKKLNLNSKTLLGKGNDASVFKSSKPNEVIKVCIRDIGFLKNFKDDLNLFKSHINNLSPFMAPIHKILYEDNNLFIYTQGLCQMIDKSHMTIKHSIYFFEFIRFLIDNNIILTDLHSKNFGLDINNKFVCFDYHGLSPLVVDNKFYRSGWWIRLSVNMTRFMCFAFAPHKHRIYGGLMKPFKSKNLEKIGGEGYLPPNFIEFMKYIFDKKEHMSVEIIRHYLETCLRDLNKHK